MSGEQRIRAFLFYLSAAVFIIGLPYILSFALGYKFDMRAFRFTKTGLIDLETQPAEATIYLDGKLLREKTPATIQELMPARYSIRLELEKHYPWAGQVEVEAGKVTRLDKIILFALRPDVKQLNQSKISSFWVDTQKQRVYYIDQQENIIYKSDLGGENFEEIGSLPEDFPVPKKWKTSPDRGKLISFTPHRIAVVYLEPQSAFLENLPFILDYPDRTISDVFWHSDSYHLILVTDKNIEVVEAKPSASPISLVSLNKKNIYAFYDTNQDALYFIDSQKAPDGKTYDNVYKLELGNKFYPFQELIKPRSNE